MFNVTGTQSAPQVLISQVDAETTETTAGAGSFLDAPSKHPTQFSTA